MPDDAPKWTVIAWRCGCHAIEWRRRRPSAPGRPPADGTLPGVWSGQTWYDTVEQFQAVHRDLIPVDVDNVAALLAGFHDLEAELAKTVSNFEEHAEVAAEQLADARHEIEVLRRINRELNDGSLYATQLILDAQRERDEARAALERERTEHARWSFEAGRQAGEFIRDLEERIAAPTSPPHGSGSLPHGYVDGCGDECNNAQCPAGHQHDRCAVACVVTGLARFRPAHVGKGPHAAWLHMHTCGHVEAFPITGPEDGGCDACESGSPNAADWTPLYGRSAP